MTGALLCTKCLALWGHNHVCVASPQCCATNVASDLGPPEIVQCIRKQGHGGRHRDHAGFHWERPRRRKAKR